MVSVKWKTHTPSLKGDAKPFLIFLFQERYLSIVPENKGWAGHDARDRSPLLSGPTYWLVCSYGGDVEEQWQGESMCPFEQAKRICQEGESPSSSSRHDIRKVGRLHSLHQTWCKLRVSGRSNWPGNQELWPHSSHRGDSSVSMCCRLESAPVQRNSRRPWNKSCWAWRVWSAT